MWVWTALPPEEAAISAVQMAFLPPAVASWVSCLIGLRKGEDALSTLKHDCPRSWPFGYCSLELTRMASEP